MLSNTSPERSFCVNIIELEFKPQKHIGDFFEKHLIMLEDHDMNIIS